MLCVSSCVTLISQGHLWSLRSSRVLFRSFEKLVQFLSLDVYLVSISVVFKLQEKEYLFSFSLLSFHLWGSLPVQLYIGVLKRFFTLKNLIFYIICVSTENWNSIYFVCRCHTLLINKNVAWKNEYNFVKIKNTWIIESKT